MPWLFAWPGTMSSRARLAASALGLALLLCAVYWWSMPRTLYVESASGNSVARILGKAPYFESDGAFIVRQFRQHRTFTHNDHVLYHALVSALHGRLGPPSLDPVVLHLGLSVATGAAGVGVLVLAGYWLTGWSWASVAAASLVAGTASYWYFASTIDTYVPSLLFSILALWVALLCLGGHRLWQYAALGAMAGVAFLFRTDAVLLAPLGLVALLAPGGRAQRLVVCGLAAALVGGGGYAWLAHRVYHVPYSEVWSWATASIHRPQASLGIWASAGNWDARAVKLTASNQLVYGVVLPGLGLTRERDILAAMSASATGPIALTGYAGLLTLVVVTTMVRMAGRAWRTWPVLLMAVTWLLVRIGFYSWWNPHDPFLFTATALPGLWLLVLLPFLSDGARLPRGRRTWGERLALAGLLVVIPLVWWHNLHVLIGPVWAMPLPE